MRQSFQFCRILLTSSGLSFLSDLGAVLDHEEPPRYPASDHCSPSQDHQRSVVKRRRDERGLFAVQIRAHHEAALIDRGKVAQALVPKARTNPIQTNSDLPLQSIGSSNETAFPFLPLPYRWAATTLTTSFLRTYRAGCTILSP